MNQVFYENVRLNYPQFLLLEYDGPTLKRKIKPKETLVNQIIIPYGKKRRLKLFKRVVRMIRAGNAYLERDYLVTPALRCIKSNQRILHQFQTGGYNIRNGIVRRKRRVRQDDGPMEQRRRIEDNFNPNLFQLVNVSYRIWFVMHLNDRDVPRSRNGFIRNVPLMEVENAIEQVGNEFIARQNYDTEITRMEHQVIPIPHSQLPLLQQRMYGTVVNYHYLQVESNTTENNDCVYQFLIKNYSKYIRKIDRKVCCPTVSYFEWHPFAVSHTNEGIDSGCSIHFKTRGNWTTKFAKVLGIEQKGVFPVILPNVIVQGPFHCYPKNLLENITKGNSIIITNGIGVTTFSYLFTQLNNLSSFNKS
jgi:hypothetical protein